MRYISKGRKDYAEGRNNLKTYVSLELHVHCGLVGGSALTHLYSGAQEEGEPFSGTVLAVVREKRKFWGFSLDKDLVHKSHPSFLTDH